MQQYQSPWKRAWVCLTLLLLLLSASLAPPLAPVQADASLVYFPQTQHFLRGAFRVFWEQRGSVTLFGYPITEEYYRNGDGKLVQYFERARFELRMVNNQPVVDLGLIGEDYARKQGASFPRVPEVPNTSTRRYFPETGHTLQGGFKSFWESRGGVDIFGFPISEELPELFPDGVVRTVQYLQRARFELHGTEVRLSLLGYTLAPCQQLVPRPQDLPPSGPLNEGDSSTCAAPTSIIIGRVYPEVSPPGTVLGFQARNYEPNETVSLWLNLPNGSVRALPYQAVANDKGEVLIGFQTDANDTAGTWSIVGQGVRSDRILLAPFRLQR